MEGNKKLLQIEVRSALDTLEKGRTLLYPSDTIWGLGCDARISIAIQEVFRLKNRPAQKSMILLVGSIEILGEYLKPLSPEVIEVMTNKDRPTSIIFPGEARREGSLGQEACAEDGSVAFRIPHSGFAAELLKYFSGPLVSSSANLSGEVFDGTFENVPQQIKQGVGKIVNPILGPKYPVKPSRILFLEPEGGLRVIRES